MVTAGYLRVSSARQRDETDSPANQERRLTDAGCTVIYRDLAVSGFKLDQRRKAHDFIRLKADIESGAIQRLLTVRVDRIARRDAIFMELADACEANGVRFESLESGTIETATPTGWMGVKMQLMMAEYYSRQLSHSVRAANAAATARGIPARPASGLPFHLEREPGTRHGVRPSPRWDQARAAVVQIGQGSITLSEAAKSIGIAQGVLGVWLRKPALLGHMATAKGDILIRDCWPALVTPDEQEAAIAMVLSRRPRWGANALRSRPPKSLSGLCNCSVCDARMSYMCSRGEEYLRCTARSDCPARTRSVRAYLIEVPLVAKWLRPHISRIIDAQIPTTERPPPEIAAWKRELRFRESTPNEYLLPADRERINELKALIAAGTPQRRTDDASMAKLALTLEDVSMNSGSWFSRTPEQRNADLRLVIASVLVDARTKSIHKVQFK